MDYRPFGSSSDFPMQHGTTPSANSQLQSQSQLRSHSHSNPNSHSHSHSHLLEPRSLDQFNYPQAEYYIGPSSQPLNVTPPLSVESLQANELAKNPVYQKLLLDSHGLAVQLGESNKLISQLWEETRSLRKQLESATSKRNLFFASRSASASTATSIAPSDSASRMQAHFMPIQHIPEEDYPKVLWYREDCQNDDYTKPSTKNKSRIPMARAIRTAEGNMIPKKAFSEIMKSVNTIYEVSLKNLPDVPTAEGIGHVGHERGDHTLSWYRANYPDQLSSACLQLEATHNLVGLCASHWKAEQLFAKVMTSKKDSSRRKKKHSQRHRSKSDVEESSSSSNDNVNVPHPPPSSLHSTTSPGGSLLALLDTPMDPVTTSSASLSKRLRTNSITNAIPDVEQPNKRARSNNLEHENQNDGSGHNHAGLGFLENPSPAQSDSNLVEQNPGTQRIEAPLLPPNEDPFNIPPHSFTAPTLSTGVDISFIQVNATLQNLKDNFSRDFPAIRMMATRLLNRLEELDSGSKANPPLAPSELFMSFLERIENADPNSTELSEDDNDEMWGHYQFTAGSMTATNVLTSWNAVNDVKFAYRLLAAAIKTCRVARHICDVHRKSSPSGALSFISDVYLERVVEQLWECVKPPPIPLPAPAGTTSQPTPPTGVSEALPDTSTEAEERSETNAKQLFQNLYIEELKAWLHSHQLVVGNSRTMKKDDLIAYIISNSATDQLPTTDDITQIVSTRQKGSRKLQRKK